MIQRDLQKSETKGKGVYNSDMEFFGPYADNYVVKEDRALPRKKEKEKENECYLGRRAYKVFKCNRCSTS